MLFLYSLRSLLVQRLAALPAFLAVFFSVALVSSMTLVIANVENLLVRSGREDNVVLLNKDTVIMSESTFPVADADKLKVLPGIVKQGGVDLASMELLQKATVRSTDSNDEADLVVRGVDPIAFEIHDVVKVTSGAMPQPGTPGVIVGAGRVQTLAKMHAANKVRVGRALWPIVGTFSAPGTLFESELWADRTAVSDALKDRSFSALVARVSGPDVIADMNKQLSNARDINAAAISEADLGRRRTRQLRPYLDVAWALTAILILSAAFAAISSMHALFLKRIREFGTLLAMGFTRGHVSVMLAFESALLVLPGMLCGYGASMLLIGRTYNFQDWGLVVHLDPAVQPLMFAVGMGGAVMLVGLSIAIVQIRRMVVLDALRAV